MATIVLWLVVMVMTFILLPLVLGIPLVYIKQRFATQPVVRKIDTLNGDPRLLQVIDDESALLRSVGFADMGIYTVSLTDSEMQLRAFLHKSKGVSVSLIVMSNKMLNSTLAEFSTRYTDGTAISTKNNAEPLSFRYPPNKHIFQHPMLSPSDLYTQHQNHCATFEAGRTIKPYSEDTISEILASIEEEYAQQLRYGVLKNAGDTYRLTLVGAMRAVFSQWLFMYFKYNPRICAPVSGTPTARTVFRTTRKKAAVLNLICWVMLCMGAFNLLESGQVNGPGGMFNVGLAAAGGIGLLVQRTRKRP